VGGANLAGGGYLLYRALTGFRTRHVMNDTAQELTRSVSAALTTLQGAASANATSNTVATANTIVAPHGASTQAHGAPASANVLQQAAPAKNTVKEQPNGR
jgi:hypothetical protein